jgi:RHS repeat-associated protein
MRSKLLMLTLLTICVGMLQQAKALRAANAATEVSVPASGGPAFSNPPTDAEILAGGILPQPLAPMSGKADAQENRTLVRQLLRYQDAQRAGALRDAVGPLTDFLRSYPGSRWRAALYLNLGIIYRQTGHLSKAMAAWQRAWDLSKGASETNAHAIADYSVGELAEFEAYLGRMEQLAPLLAAIKERPLHGTGAENISNASQGLAEMRTRPQDAFRCGPMALHRICLLEGRPDRAMKLEDARSTTRGTSLTQVAELSHQIGLDYQMAHREPGASLIVPAVMHWKVGHFAAIVKESGGLYQIEDPTFGENILVSRATIDQEASGYFVVPAGRLPMGWQPVSRARGDTIWGRGYTTGNDPNGTSPNDEDGFCDGSDCCGGGGSSGAGGSSSGGNGSGSGGGGGSFTGINAVGGISTANVQAMVVGLSLHDAPLRYETPKGPPIAFELYYSHRDALQPAIFTYTNFGSKWTSNWISYFTDNTATSGTANLYMPGGGGEPYVFNGTTYEPGVDDQALVTKLVAGGKTAGFSRELPDGSVQTFTHAFGTNQYFLSSVADPQGNKVTLTYDTHTRITTITDAAGEKTTLTYGLAGNIYLVTKVTDPFGRSALFTYNGNGELASITDTLGITSSYTYLYGSGDFITTLTTPYGKTTFTYGDSTTDYLLSTERYVTITDPLGQTERVEFHQFAPGIADSDPPNTIPTGMSVANIYLVYRNTFVWDKNQYQKALLPDGSLDYTKATLIHWLHSSNLSITSRTPESIRQPLENRVWYNYPNESGGIQIGTSNQATAIGRVLDDGTTQLWAYQRNSFGHLTQSTDPIGRQQTLTYAANGIDLVSIANTTGGGNQLLAGVTYNAQHEPLTVTDASGQTTKYTYNGAGQVLTATDPLNQVTQYTYGPSGLLLSVKQPSAGALTTFAYDAFNRLRSSTNPLGYELQFSYDVADRLTGVAYPNGTSTHNTYHLLDLASTTDSLKRTTSFIYDALRRLVQVTDPLGRTDKYGYCSCGAVTQLTDGNGHTTNWSYDDEDRPIGKTFADGSEFTYNYESTTSRLKSITDALNQVTTYTYNLDNTVNSIAYLNTINPTPTASFTYDPAFLRLTQMTDGSGTTAYAYYSITTPPALGANLLKSVTGPHGDVITVAYDALERPATRTVDGSVEQLGFDTIGRVVTDKNALYTFNIAYLGGSLLPVSLNSASTNGFEALYSYYGSTGNDLLETITNQFHTGATITPISAFQYTYDADDEVTSTVIQKQFATAITRATTYDAAGQLLSLAASAGGGSDYKFGYDKGANRISETVGASTTSFTYNSVNELTGLSPDNYDKDGEPLTLGAQSFKWDAADRVISASSGANTTKFAYDGLNHRTRITQIVSGKTVSDKFYFWFGNNVLLETNAAGDNALTKRYFAEGVIQQAQPFYYATDQLGSVRELVDASGVVQASYDYDPYGVRSQLMGTENSDFGFAALFHESQSGLDLARYRDYNAPLRRWLSRDPIGEPGGINLYAYVANGPTDAADPLGLQNPQGQGPAILQSQQEALQALGQEGAAQTQGQQDAMENNSRMVKGMGCQVAQHAVGNAPGGGFWNWLLGKLGILQPPPPIQVNTQRP